MTFAQVSPGYSCDPILSRRQREYNFSFIFPLKIHTLLNQQRKQATGMSIYDNSSYKISCVIGYLRLTLRRNVRISIGLKVTPTWTGLEMSSAVAFLLENRHIMWAQSQTTQSVFGWLIFKHTSSDTGQWPATKSPHKEQNNMLSSRNTL